MPARVSRVEGVGRTLSERGATTAGAYQRNTAASGDLVGMRSFSNE